MSYKIFIAVLSAATITCCPALAARLLDNTISAQYDISSAGIVAQLSVRGRLSLTDKNRELGVPAFPGISKFVGSDCNEYTVILEKSYPQIDKVVLTKVHINIPDSRKEFSSTTLPGIILVLDQSAKDGDEVIISMKTIDNSSVARNLGILYFEPCPSRASISVIINTELKRGDEVVSNLRLANKQRYVPKTNCTAKNPQYLFYRIGDLNTGGN